MKSSHLTKIGINNKGLYSKLYFFYFSDTYDLLVCVGALSVCHVNEQCLEPLAAITKPGNIFFQVKRKTITDNGNTTV